MSKETFITVKWNYNTGEAEISLSAAFREAHRVTQLDCLVDARKLIADAYEQVLNEPDQQRATKIP